MPISSNPPPAAPETQWQVEYHFPKAIEQPDPGEVS
jgi:hypothetical protein